MLVPGITSVDLGNWNEALQCFIGTDKTTLHDNGIIGDVMTRLNELLDTYTFSTGKELFDAYKGVEHKGVKKVPTMGEFLEMIVTEERNKEIGASSNYQLYNTLLNKLKGVNLKKLEKTTPTSTITQSPLPICKENFVILHFQMTFLRMSTVSKYFAAKKQYYTELFELAQLTTLEKVIIDI